MEKMVTIGLPWKTRQAVIRIRGRSYSIAEAGAIALREHTLGNHQNAVDIYNRIRVKTPGHAEIHINLGVSLQAMRRYDDALKSFDQAIAIKPDHAEAHNNRGAILQLLNRQTEALASYDQAITLKSDYANAHHNRGCILKQLRRYDEALQSFEKAVAVNPDHAEAHNNRGIALQEMRRYDEALASFGKAMEITPTHAGACNNRGVIRVIKGQMAEAERMFLQAIRLHPVFPDAWFNLVNIRKYQTVDDPDVEDIGHLLKLTGSSLDAKEQLHFALGKIFDDCGRYDEAFAFYRVANEIRNCRVAYNPDKVRQLSDGIIQAFTGDFVAEPFSFASASAVPLFIVGMPRSGTTLLASILSNHRSIATSGELPNLTDLAACLPGLTGNRMSYPNPEAGARLVEDYEKCLKHGSHPDRPHVIDKNPLNFRNLGFIMKMFPRARIVHCRRHPLDTAISNYFQRFPLHLDYSFDLGNIAHFYGEYSRLMEHWRTVLAPQMIEVHYEDLVVNTEHTTRKALGFLGLEWDERCLAPHTNPCAVETASQWQVRQPIYHQSLERWRHYEKQLASLKGMFLSAGLNLS